MGWRIELSRRAGKQLVAIDAPEALRIVRAGKTGKPPFLQQGAGHRSVRSLAISRRDLGRPVPYRRWAVPGAGGGVRPKKAMWNDNDVGLMLFESNLTRLEKVGVDDMSDAIWKRVYRCAEELTQQGVTPFSRGDLIRCVQRDDPSCSSDSINPVIQGLTDNLRGGAPSIVGKTLLHSVERGRFVLRDATAQPVSKESVNNSGYREIRALENERNRPAEISCEALLIGGFAFKYVCEIEPERNEDGTLRVSDPQCRYSNGEGLALNKYGTGPFCKFKIPWNITKSGVYAFVVNGHAKYVGECENLSKRFNMGYGNISPRNCYRGGQETNCRINTLLFESVSEGLKVALWFHETYDYKKVESDLRAQEKFEWNRA